jgi:hypothetical protein
LLQDALANKLPTENKADSAIVEIAQGHYSAPGNDVAWWHYGDPRSNTPNIVASIWGEGPVSQILPINGERVMLLWPPILAGRSWESSFFGPPLEAMPPSVVIQEELRLDTCEAWLNALRIDTVT